MSTEKRRNADGSDQDNWDDHWDRFGEISRENPANAYRHAVILKLLGPLPAGAVLLDIGSGQGQFAIDYQAANPQVAVYGVEYSLEGVRLSQQAAHRAGVGAQFIQRDLLRPVAPEAGQPLATDALCSEVLEHVEQPSVLMRNATSLLGPGAKVVVTVPGGPRTAFDKHIGHFRHFTAPALRRVLTDAGLDDVRVFRTGFPFFNLYKLAVLVRGQKLVDEVAWRTEQSRESLLQRAATAFFRQAFRLNLANSPFGWQLAATARVRRSSS